MLEKLTSRKFIMALIAFLGSLGVSIAGLSTESEAVAIIGVICSVFSAALYAAVEAWVDVEREEKDGEEG